MKRRKRTRVPSQQQVAVLRALLEGASHGYEMMKGTQVGPGTLYGLLKRLFDEGYVNKSTEVVSGRCRVLYTLTEAGAHYAERALLEDELERGVALYAPLENEA